MSDPTKFFTTCARHCEARAYQITVRQQSAKIAELEKDLAFYKCCMKSGENAKDSDAPSQRYKALKDQG